MHNDHYRPILIVLILFPLKVFIHQSIDVKFEDLYVKYFRVLVFAREQDIARRGLRCWRRLWPAPDSASAKLGTFFITKPGSLSLGGRLPGPGLVLGRGHTMQSLHINTTRSPASLQYFLPNIPCS